MGKMKQKVLRKHQWFFYDLFNMNMHMSDYIFALDIHCRREKERNTDRHTDGQKARQRF